MTEVYLDNVRAEMVRDLQEKLDQARTGELQGYAAVWQMSDDSAVPDAGGYFDPNPVFMALSFLADTLKVGVYGAPSDDDGDSDDD